MGQVVKTRDGNAVNNPYLGIVNRQALIMIRAACELGFTPAARASLGMMDEGWRGGPRLIDEGDSAAAMDAFFRKDPESHQ